MAALAVFPPDPCPCPPRRPTLSPEDYGMLKMHALNGSQRQADGAAAYAENLRYDYLEGKSNVSLPEALGPRYIQGPHPQYASPDAKAA